MGSFGQPHPRLSVLQVEIAVFLPTPCRFPDGVPPEHRLAGKVRKLLVKKHLLEQQKSAKSTPGWATSDTVPGCLTAAFHLENLRCRFSRLR